MKYKNGKIYNLEFEYEESRSNAMSNKYHMRITTNSEVKQ